GGGIGGLHRPAFDGLAHGTPPIEARARAVAIPALAGPVGFLRAAHARPQIGQFHFLPQPVDDVVDLELEQKFEAAVVAAAAALAGPGCAARPAEGIARLGRALSDALLLLG